MKFAIICHGIFDGRIGMGLGRALFDLGQSCTLVSYKNKEPLTGFDVIIEPQHGRSDIIPKDAVYITWVFEFYGAGDPDYSTLYDRDLLYSFGEPQIIGCPRFKQWRGSLTVAVDPHLLTRPLIEPTLDFSLAGAIPPLVWFCFPTMMPEAHRFNIIADITTMVFRNTKVAALTGSFDQQTEFARFKEMLHELIDKRDWKFSSDWIDEMHSYGAKLLHNCARLANRGHLAKLALSVSQNIEFWGQFWDLWEITAKYAKPFTNEPEPIYDLYQRSRINLHDNIFGFSLHWRVLEAMAVGGFIMTHPSPHIGSAGQMTETFVPEVHFGEYTVQNFTERTRYWLQAHAERKKAIEEARKVIRDKHLWKHRAQQILDDLANA